MRKGFILLILFIGVISGCATKIPNTEKKYALVIGNNNYGNYAKLKNSLNDAEDISEILIKLNYQVDLCLNANLAEMELKIKEFAENLSKNENSEGFFYFAGMGAMINGNNYMVPTGISASNEEQLSARSYKLDELFDNLITANNIVNIVIIDACFSNVSSGNNRNQIPSPPAGQDITIGQVIYSQEVKNDGLDYIGKFTKDIFYFQSALPGKDAFDGEGRNSPFTKALLENIVKPQKLTDLVQEIIKDTNRNSGGDQRPYFKANLFKFKDYLLN